MEQEDIEMQNVADGIPENPVNSRGGGKERRLEQMGQKRLDKEVYKIGKDRQRQQENAIEAGDRRQWSR